MSYLHWNTSYLHWDMSQAGNRRLVLTAVVIAVIVAVAIISLIQHDPSSAVHVPAWYDRVHGLHGHLRSSFTQARMTRLRETMAGARIERAPDIDGPERSSRPDRVPNAADQPVLNSLRPGGRPGLGTAASTCQGAGQANVLVQTRWHDRDADRVPQDASARPAAV